MSSSWSQKLFGCTNDLETCKIMKYLNNLRFQIEIVGCCGIICGPCLMCRNAGYLDRSGALCCFLGFWIPCIPIYLLRRTAREKYNIEVSRHDFERKSNRIELIICGFDVLQGSVAEDAVTACLCTSCVNCQIDAEIKARGDYK